MTLLKKSWIKKEPDKQIPINVMDHIAARGSFVVVRCERLFKEYKDPNEKKKDEPE